MDRSSPGIRTSSSAGPVGPRSIASRRWSSAQARVRWTRNDARRELVNSATAEVTAVKDGTVTLGLENGRVLDMRRDDPRLRHVDRAWASTVYAFQGYVVDTAIAAMEANYPHLTTQKTLFVEIGRAPTAPVGHR